MDHPLINRGETLRFFKGILSSYSQIFFSDNLWFAGLLLLVTFINPYSGIAGLFSVVLSNTLAYHLGYDRNHLSKGVYGFNSLLIALGLGVFFEHSVGLFVVIILSSFLSLMLSLTLQGILGKYFLPFLSLPFLITIWMIILATRSFDALTINDKGIFLLNELYKMGGQSMVKFYEWSISLRVPLSLKAYFTSLGAIFFQFNMIAGLFIAIGLLLYSRIAFTLSLIGFYSAWCFYHLLGVDMTIFVYNYIGFNYILTAIAIGAYFFVPSRSSYIWAVVLTPLVALVTISFYNLLGTFQLPVYSLPFNVVVLLFIYSLKLRVYPSGSLMEVYVQQHSPEENVYTSLVSKNRFRFASHIPVKLPFWGEWFVSQGHNGSYTHKDVYRHAWDFVIKDAEGKQYKGEGDLLTDYYCYGKTVIAPADGVVSDVQDGIADNEVGKENLVQNWGNTIVLKHHDYLFTNLSHLKLHSIKVKKGDHVKAGDSLAVCGNSGRSPYPHLHFQMQSTPYIGSKTIGYPISHYNSWLNGKLEPRSFETPAASEVVSNIPVDKLLSRVFTFTTGQVLDVDVLDGNCLRRSRWEVVTNYLNQSYLWEEITGSSAYFMNDGTLFRFTHFEGNKKSGLYMAYLALYEVLLASFEGISVESTIPVHHIFSKCARFGNDFLVPFKSLLGAGYTLRYDADATSLSPDKMILHSRVTKKVFGHEKVKYSFGVIISEQGIQEIKSEAIC